MERGKRGSVSVLFLTVVVPFFFMLLVVAIDLEHFFGLTEEVQRVLDAEARYSISKAISGADLSSRVQAQLQGSRAYLTIHDVSLTRDAQAGEIVARGSFNGIFSGAVSAVLGPGAFEIPFEISSRARRAHTSVMVVLDRSILGGADPCGDANFSHRAALAGRVVRALYDNGAAEVRVLVTPGRVDPVELLLPVDGADLVPRCAPQGDRLPFNVGAVAGVADGSMAGPRAVATSVGRLLLVGAGAAIERRAIIMIAPQEVQRARTVSETFALLDYEAARQALPLRAVAISVGGVAGADPFLIKSGLESGRARYLNLLEDQARSPDLTFAVVRDIQGRTFVAR